jgi:hypothetical protein
VVGDEEYIVEDRKNAKKMDGVVRSGRGLTSGSVRGTAGAPTVLAPSDPVEGGGEYKCIIRVGAIGCSAFGFNKCSFGSI